MPKYATDIRSQARSYGKAAIKTLAGIMSSKTAPPASRIMAAQTILDRGWGKAPQVFAGDVDNPITIIKHVIVELAAAHDRGNDILELEANTVTTSIPADTKPKTKAKPSVKVGNKRKKPKK